MNYREIRLFLEDQIRDAERKGNPIQDGFAAMVMIEYLLECIQKEPAVFTQQTGRDLRRAFLKSGGVARYAAGFAQQYGGRIRTEASNVFEALKERTRTLESLERDIHQLEVQTGQLEQQNQKVARETREKEEKNQALLVQRETLERRREEARELEEEIQELNRILAEITPERVQASKEEAAQLRRKIGPLKADWEQAERERIEAQQQFDQLQDRLGQSRSEAEQLRASCMRMTEELTQMEYDLKEGTRDAERLTERIEQARQELEELRAMQEEYKRVTNQLMKEGFVYTGTFDENSFRKRTEELDARCRTIREEYQTLLGGVLEDAESLYKKLMKRAKG